MERSNPSNAKYFNQSFITGVFTGYYKIHPTIVEIISKPHAYQMFPSKQKRGPKMANVFHIQCGSVTSLVIVFYLINKYAPAFFINSKPASWWFPVMRSY